MRTWFAIALSVLAVGFGLAVLVGLLSIDPVRRTTDRVVEVSSIGTVPDDAVAIPSTASLDPWPSVRAEIECELAGAPGVEGARTVARLVPIPDREAAMFFDSFPPGADGVTRLLIEGRVLPVRRRLAGIAVTAPATAGDGRPELQPASALVEFGVPRAWVAAGALPDLTAALDRESPLAAALDATGSSLDAAPEPVALVDPAEGSVLIGEGQETGRFRYGSGIYSARPAMQVVTQRVHAPRVRRVLGVIGWISLLLGTAVPAALWQRRARGGVVLLGRTGPAIILTATACALAVFAWIPLVEAGIAWISDLVYLPDRAVQPVAAVLVLVVVVPALALAAAAAPGPGLRADRREVVVRSVDRAHGIAWDEVRAIEVRGAGRSRRLVLRGVVGEGVHIPRPGSPRTCAAAVHALMSTVPESRRPMLRRGVRDWMRSPTPRA